MCLIHNRDWDPGYLKEIFDMDFYDYSEHWSSSSLVTDSY